MINKKRQWKRYLDIMAKLRLAKKIWKCKATVTRSTGILHKRFPYSLSMRNRHLLSLVSKGTMMTKFINSCYKFPLEKFSNFVLGPDIQGLYTCNNICFYWKQLCYFYCRMKCIYLKVLDIEPLRIKTTVCLLINVTKISEFVNVFGLKHAKSYNQKT